MPMYDYQCGNSDCVVFFEALRPIKESDTASCPKCGSDGGKVWISKPSTAIGDAMDETLENVGPVPVRFTSKIEMHRYLKEHGLVQMVRHTGVPGTDKSPHTTNWAGMDAATLENARILVTRQGGIRHDADKEAEALQGAVDSGQAAVGVPVGGDRNVGVRIGQVFHGVLDHTILKGR